MRTTDGTALRKLCVRLSQVLRSDFLDLMNTPIPDLLETTREAKEATKNFGKKRRV